VLWCEEWTKKYPTIKFASCHPGWVDTPGVEAAYGSNKAYLEPLRNLWEGSEGIAWLLVTPSSNIAGGEFYLDRTPRVKHMAGAFFSEGSYTKNTPEEVEEMMSLLEKWSTLPLNEGPLETVLPDAKVSKVSYEARKEPLKAMNEKFNVKRYMGKWHVQANIPTVFDADTINNTEEYTWDEERQMVLVSFKYSNPVKTQGDDGSDKISPGPVKEIKQHGTLMNACGSEWALKVKFLFYIPVPARYLVIAVDEDVEEKDKRDDDDVPYQSCMIGVPDRSTLWIMNRDESPMSEESLAAYTLKARLLGYDLSKLVRVPVAEPYHWK
jgi:dehydrogenase/reductase SDR family protein 12